ncbi:MAG: hypothetical protein AB1726_10790 [Planctomycetota bacterium]
MKILPVRSCELALLLLPAGLALGSRPGAGPQDDDLPQRVSELETKIDVLADEVERFTLGELVPTLGEGRYGLGPAASKVYAKDEGTSIGGYGEALFQEHAGAAKSDVFDLLRTVLYFGYRFGPHWVLNSEIEIEHASTEEEGAVSVEFAALDYLGTAAVNARAGLVLVPMGFLNELHEPPTFLAATRPETERRIIPSTWRETGVGVFGETGDLSYRLYVVTALDALGFTGSGLRDGRQNGSKARAEDFALTGRVDWIPAPGLLAGLSAHRGDAGQGREGLGATATTIVEAHGEVRARGLWLRGLIARATVDDVALLNAATGESVGESLEGQYVEMGYDLLAHLAPDSGLSAGPYARFESFDTQAEVASGSAANPANDEEIATFGVDFRPLPSIVIKVEYQDFDQDVDRFNVSLGYSF